jgi:hypothetical protein
MKTGLLFLLISYLLLSPVMLNAQEEIKKNIEIEAQLAKTHRDTTRNEISLNILNTLVFGALDISYERILTNHSSISSEVFSKVFNKNKGEKGDLSKTYAKDFSLTTKFKYFLDEKNMAWGYYAEAFGMISSGVNEKKVSIIDRETGNSKEIEAELEYIDVAFGIGVGRKFISKNGFFLDAAFGIGRNLFQKDAPVVVILPNINIGYRY